MIFRNACLFLLSLSSTVRVAYGQYHDGDKQLNATRGMILHEDFFSYYADENSKENLRHRQLQTTPICRTTSPQTVFACGGHSGGASDPCKNSDASCDDLPRYSCSCTGLNPTETSCSYCQIRTANAIACQMTGTSVTYVALDFTVRTCSCDYIGNGEVRQVCYTPTERPTSPPTPVPLVPPPTGDRAPTPTASGCQPQDPRDVTICIESTGSDVCDNALFNCALMPEYPCSCPGLNPTGTLCNYCQVRTSDSIICQMVGSSMTFLAPDFTWRTCTCDQAGPGQVTQVCYSPIPVNLPTSPPSPTVAPVDRGDNEPGPSPGIPTPPSPTTMAPTVETCKATFEKCTSSSECCSGFCDTRLLAPARNTCRSTPRISRDKLSGETRGGAAGSSSTKPIDIGGDPFGGGGRKNKRRDLVRGART
mmetsp:Transcript_66304/g.183140  ORF Transcript_66304/g.183140 Transcript_66304/m.183140 type:complete len:421 (+) Transcript_66304:112-1374(+)